jgi:hypothetical protein
LIREDAGAQAHPAAPGQRASLRRDVPLRSPAGRPARPPPTCSRSSSSARTAGSTSTHWGAWRRLFASRRCYRSGFLAGQEYAEQLVVGALLTPAGRWRLGEELCADLVNALFMGVGRVRKPRAKRLGDLEAICVIQHGQPAVGEALPQLTYKLPAHQARELVAPLRFGKPTRKCTAGARRQRASGSRPAECGV